MAKTQFKVDNTVNIKRPKMFAVIMHNDDYTTMDFVVEVLTKVFHKTSAEATDIMMSVHNQGKGVAGVYTYDIAITKKTQTEAMAGQKNFPLKITLDEAME